MSLSRRILLDTNVFRHIADGQLSPERTAEIRRTLEGRAAVVHVSLVTIVELVSGIRPDNREHFTQYRDAIRAVLSFDPTILPETEWVMRHFVARAEDAPVLVPPNGTIDACRFIACAASYDELERGRIAKMPDGTFVPELLRTKLAVDLRLDGEDRFGRMFEEMRDSLVRAAATQTAPDPDKSKIAFLLGYLNSEDYVRFYVTSELRKYGLLRVGDLADRVAVDRLRPHVNFMRSIVRTMLTTGYNPRKNKNDYYDALLLVHLADPDLGFVTSDQRLLNKLRQYDRNAPALSIDEWLT